MKRSQKIILYTATLITAKSVIPAKAGIQASSLRRQGTSFYYTGFPRIKYGAGLIKSGMTNHIRPVWLCITMTLITTLILVSTILIEPMMVYGQPIKKISISPESGRDPFALPPGARLLSKEKTTSGTQEVSSKNISPPSLKISAILISDRVRLASIDRHIVTVGDSIHDEKVLEIKNDRVILGKGDKTRILLLSQSPVQLTVEGK